MSRAKLTERQAGVQSALLAWYRAHQRDLPWRRRSDAYAIWLSEVMLQQTRVATVIDYYRRFLERFPTVDALAAGGLDDVLKAWEGLGYYSRARNLHRAARIVVDEHGGRLPESPQELRRLPGIGEYTAGAIASIAFGADEPVLDGNVSRVLCRVFRIAGNPRSGPTRRKLWALARKLIPAGEASWFNQAMMDLGATICTPRSPACSDCPLAEPCLARARGEQDKLPRKPPRKTIPHRTIVAGIVRRNGRILIDRRPADGLLGGLWEFPGGKVEPDESLPDALRREIGEEVGLDVTVGAKVAAVEHAYTHFRITLHAFECRAKPGRARAIQCDAVKWVLPRELDDYAFPRANRRIIDVLTGGSQ